MVQIIPTVFAIGAIVTGVIAAPPAPVPPSPPPHVPAPFLGPDKPKPPPSHSPLSTNISNSFLSLALSDPSQLISGNAFDKQYSLPAGTMEKCLDAVYHGEQAQELDVGSDFVVINNAPIECSSIVREIVGRMDNPKEEDLVAFMSGENSIRLNDFKHEELELLFNINPTLFNVRIL